MIQRRVAGGVALNALRLRGTQAAQGDITADGAVGILYPGGVALNGRYVHLRAPVQVSDLLCGKGRSRIKRRGLRYVARNALRGCGRTAAAGSRGEISHARIADIAVARDHCPVALDGEHLKSVACVHGANKGLLRIIRHAEYGKVVLRYVSPNRRLRAAAHHNQCQRRDHKPFECIFHAFAPLQKEFI